MENCSVLLTNQRWVRQGPVAVRGSGFYQGRWHSSAELCRCFSDVGSADAFERLLREINGFFAVVAETAGGVFAAVDRLRSIPLFYACLGASLSISDQATTLPGGDEAASPGSLPWEEFRLTGFVTGQETLSLRVRQIQAGEMLTAEAGPNLSVSTRRYFRFTPGETSTETREQLLARLGTVATKCIQRLIERAAGATIVVPLSGGWDSRLIAAELKQQGYDKVLCFTYGRPGNHQSEISRSVASALGFPWEMVTYTEAAWRDWFNSKVREDYAEYAHNLVSIPHYQDWPAIWDLKNRRLLAADSVVVPGHFSGFAAGGHVPPVLLGGGTCARSDLVRMLLEAHYRLWPLDGAALRQALWRRVDATLPPGDTFSAETAIALLEEWEWAERQCKLIINSLRVYEFWGVDWWMPLGDCEFIDFWRTVPVQLRARKRLLAEFVARLYSQVAGVPMQQARERDGDRLRGRALDYSLRLGCYQWAKNAHNRLVDPILRARTRKQAYHRDPLAWYGIMDRETFQREFSGSETFHSFIARHVLRDLRI